MENGKESEKSGGWKEKAGKTEKEMGGLYQGGYGGSGSDGEELGKARRRRYTKIWMKPFNHLKLLFI